jgi:hypothetical protein
MFAKSDHTADDLVGLVYGIPFAEDRLVLRDLEEGAGLVQRRQFIITRMIRIDVCQRLWSTNWHGRTALLLLFDEAWAGARKDDT